MNLTALHIPAGPRPCLATCYSCVCLSFQHDFLGFYARSRLFSVYPSLGILWQPLPKTWEWKLSRCPIVQWMDKGVSLIEPSKPERWRPTACLKSQPWRLGLCDLTSLSQLTRQYVGIIIILFLILWYMLLSPCQTYVLVYFLLLLNFLFCIGIQQISNVVKVSGGLHRDSAIDIHLSILTQTPLLSSCHMALSRVPCAIQWILVGYPF